VCGHGAGVVALLLFPPAFAAFVVAAILISARTLALLSAFLSLRPLRRLLAACGCVC